MREEFRKGGRRSHSLLSGGQFAIGVLTGVLLAVVVFLIFNLGDTSSDAAGASGASLQISAVAVAFVSLLIAFNAFIEQRRIRQAGTDPVLIAHLRPDDDEPMLVHLAITTVGGGCRDECKVHRV